MNKSLEIKSTTGFFRIIGAELKESKSGKDKVTATVWPCSESGKLKVIAKETKWFLNSGFSTNGIMQALMDLMDGNGILSNEVAKEELKEEVFQGFIATAEFPHKFVTKDGEERINSHLVRFALSEADAFQAVQDAAVWETEMGNSVNVEGGTESSSLPLPSSRLVPQQAI